MNLVSNTTFSLHKKDVVWFLEKGSVNLFAVEKKGPEKGTRHNLATLEAPSYLFSFNEENPDFEIVAITETESHVGEMKISQLDEKKLLPHITHWIQTLSAFQKNEPTREISTILPDKGEVNLGKMVYFESARNLTPEKKGRVDWILVETGKIHLFNYSDPATLKAQDVYPIAHNIWMHASKDSKIVVTDILNVSLNGLLHKGLEKFNALFFLYLRFNERFLEKEDLHRLIVRKMKESHDLDQIFTSMTLLLNPVEVLPPAYHDSLFRACQYLGTKQNIEIIHPERTKEKKDRESLIKEICETSQIRFRAVALDGHWWREESGSLLAFYGNEQKPVVLLNLSSGRYTMVDPTTGEKTKINSKRAEEFFPFAYYFYRPFPDELKTGKEVLKWYFKQNYRDLIPLLGYGMIAALLGLFPSIAAAILFNVVIPNVMVPLLKQIILALIFATISTSLFFLFRSFILVRIQGLASHEIWTAFWDRLLKLPSQFFHRYTSGNLFNMMSSIEEIRTQLSANGARVILSGLFSFFYFLIMALYSVRLTMIPLFIVFVISIVTFVAVHFRIRILSKSLNLKGKINGALVQMLGAVAKFRIFGSETEGFAYWGSQFTEAKKYEMQAQKIQNFVIVTNAVLSFLGPALLFAYAIILQNEGLIPTWVFLAFNSAFLPFIYSLFDLSNTIIDMASVSSLWNRARVILEEPLEMTKKKERPGKLVGDISFDRVSFRYGDSSPMILEDVSLQIRHKEFVAIVGPSGSGKSTILKMLLGFIHPHSGGVYFDGKELDQLNLHDVRKQIGVVLQESGFIMGSIFDNITCGGIYPREDIENAIALSGFEAELEKFPMGLNTVVTSSGSTFSGGQKQKLLIARALVGKPKILIFDEATSFLDNRSQDQVSRNIENLEITRIVSAHRLSTIRKADRIYVLDHGKVIQTGTFDTLAKEPGMFQTMLGRQQI